MRVDLGAEPHCSCASLPSPALRWCTGATSSHSWKPGDHPRAEHAHRPAFELYCLFALIEACRSPLSPGGIDLSSRKAQENTRPPFAPLPLSVPRLQAQEKKSQSQLPVRSGPVPSTLVCSVSAVKPAPSLPLGGVETLFKPSARTFFLRSRMCVPFA